MTVCPPVFRYFVGRTQRVEAERARTGGNPPQKFLFPVLPPFPAPKHNPPARTAFPPRTFPPVCIPRPGTLRFSAGSPLLHCPILQEILCLLQARRKLSCKFARCVFLTCKTRKTLDFFVTIDKSMKISYDVAVRLRAVPGQFMIMMQRWFLMDSVKKKVLVIGVIGADVHAVGNKILYHAFTEAGFDVVNLGVMVSQEEYIAAAIESNADAIVVSSLYGQGELDCRGMRQKCDEAGLKGIPLLVGGNIVIGKQKFEDVEKRFKDMGFDRAFPPNTTPETTIEALRELLHMDGDAQ